MHRSHIQQSDKERNSIKTNYTVSHLSNLIPRNDLGTDERFKNIVNEAKYKNYIRSVNRSRVQTDSYAEKSIPYTHMSVQRRQD